MRVVDTLGRWAAAQVSELGSVALLPYLAVKGAVIERSRGRGMVIETTAAQVYFGAVQPLPVFATVSLVSGFVFMVAADALLRPVGVGNYVPNVVVVGLAREFLPLLLALMLIGRTGSAISTELGYMRVNREIDALAVAGINIDYAVVFPRVLGLVLSALGLITVMSAIAIVGGYLCANLVSFVSVSFAFGDILHAFSLETLVTAWLKAALFGVVIGAASCFHGLSVGAAYTEIPRANSKATMLCLVVCFALNALVSVYSTL